MLEARFRMLEVWLRMLEVWLRMLELAAVPGCPEYSYLPSLAQSPLQVAFHRGELFQRSLAKNID